MAVASSRLAYIGRTPGGVSGEVPNITIGRVRHQPVTSQHHNLMTKPAALASIWLPINSAFCSKCCKRGLWITLKASQRDEGSSRPVLRGFRHRSTAEDYRAGVVRNGRKIP